MPSSKPLAKNLRGKKRKLSYSDLTLDDLRQGFGIVADVKPLFRRVAPLTPGAWLVEALERGQSGPLVSEKARAEFLVAPILMVARDLCKGRVSLYSGIRLDVAPDKGLKGICDFIFSQSPPLPTLQAPIMVLVEAKKNDVGEGIGQCAAEMVAAQIFNREAGTPMPMIHGCVTTGETWQFLQLTGSRLSIDEDKYFIDNVAKIMGILKQVLSIAGPNRKKERTK